MSVTSIIKKALDYPQRDFKNTVVFAGFFILFSILSNLANYFLFSDVNEDMLKISENAYDLIVNFYSSLSATDWVIIIICSIVAFIVYLLIEGYIYRVYKGEDMLPEFDNFKLMLKQGIEVFAVTIIYDILPFIVILIGCYISVENIYDNGFWLVVIGTVLLIVADLFLKPFAVANMVKKGEFKESLDMDSITERILQIGILPYIGAVIFVIIICSIVYSAITVLMTCSLFLSGIPYIQVFLIVIFVIIGAITGSYLNLFSNKVYQLLYD